MNNNGGTRDNRLECVHGPNNFTWGNQRKWENLDELTNSKDQSGEEDRTRGRLQMEISEEKRVHYFDLALIFLLLRFNLL